GRAVPGVDAAHRPGPPAGAQLQAHADAARAVAVPAVGAHVPAPAERRGAGAVEPGLPGPGAARRAAPAPLPSDRLRGLRASAALEAAEVRGPVGQVADRRGRRPR